MCKGEFRWIDDYTTSIINGDMGSFTFYLLSCYFAYQSFAYNRKDMRLDETNLIRTLFHLFFVFCPILNTIYGSFGFVMFCTGVWNAGIKSNMHEDYHNIEEYID